MDATIADQAPDCQPRRKCSRWETAGRWSGLAVVAAAALPMLWRSWGTWPDPLVDFGRELYVPWQLIDGRVLYRDIAYLNGPLSPYLNAAWFELFGVGLRTLTFVNLAIWVILLCMLYRILLEIGSRFSATIACVIFTLLYSFGQYEPGFGNYNYVCPYYHEMTHGLVLSVAGILCLHWYTVRRHLVYPALAGLMTGLVFLTKAEIFLAGATALLAGLGLTMWADHRERTRAALVLSCFSGAALLPITVAVALLSRAMPLADALHATLGSWRFVFDPRVSGLLFYRVEMGLDDPVQNVKGMMGAAAYYGVFLLPAALVAMLVRKRRGAGVASAVVMFFLVAVALGVMWHRMPWLAAARPLPLFLLVLGVTLCSLFARWRPKPPESARWILQITIVVFALLLLLRMLLNSRVHNYGFVLSMPATLVLVVALLDWIPWGLKRLGGYGPVFRSAVLGGMIVVVLAHLDSLERVFETKSESVSSGVDAFKADGRAKALNWAVAEVTRWVEPDQTLAVFPECVMINYLSRRENPTPYHRFDPLVIMLFGEQQMLRSLQTHPPDFVLVLHVDYDEFGYRFFGRDYGQRMLAWIESNYHRVSSYGAPPLVDERFGMLLLRRNAVEE